MLKCLNFDRKETRKYDLFSQYALVSVEEAVKDADIVMFLAPDENQQDIYENQVSLCTVQNVKDEFIDSEISLYDYIFEIVRSYKELSEKKFIINSEEFNNPISTYKSSEIVYGLRNFIGNANKSSNEKIEKG